MCRKPNSIFLFCLLIALSTGLLRAQCEPDWLPGDGIRGVNGAVRDMIRWDPDGIGPQPEVVVLVGTFTLAGDTLASNVVAYELATREWQALGDGTDGPIEAVVEMPNGDLVVAGEFSAAGGTPANRLARWDGQAWSAVGAGVGPGPSEYFAGVQDLAVLPNGDLVVGGYFTDVAGQPADHLARWDGTSWSSIGGLNGAVLSLAVLANGNLVVGGLFDMANGAVVNSLAEWDGNTWHDLDGGLIAGFGATVNDMLVASNGDLYVGGSFAVAGSVVTDNLARWDGTNWHAIGQVTGVSALAFNSAGNLVATGGNFIIPNTYIPKIAEWTGSGWVQLAPSTFIGGSTTCLLGMPTGEVLLGGNFSYVGSPSSSHRGVALFQGGAVEALHGGLDGPIHDVAQLDNGALYVAGDFDVIGDIAAPSGVAVRTAGQWGAVNSVEHYEIEAFGQMPSGEVVLVGDMSLGPVYSRVGTSLAPLGGQWAIHGDGFSTLRWNGELVVGGRFGLGFPTSVNSSVAVWDGAAWSSLGLFAYGTSPYVEVNALATAANGDLIAGGAFDDANGVPAPHIARFDGTSWHSMGAGLNGRVHAIACLSTGDIVAGGEFTWSGSTYVQNVARWDGAAWQPMGPAGLSHRVYSLQALPDGSVVAGGQFVNAGVTQLEHLARWNGVEWLPLATGADDIVRTMQWTGTKLLVGGDFLTVADVGSSHFAELAATCPADATSVGSGCGMLLGNSLTTASAPWIGSTFTATASGLSAASVALAIYGGTSANLPLATVLPQSLPGCQLLVTPLILELHLPVAGAVTTSVPLPPSIALAGQTLHEQLAAIEIDAGGNLLSAATSNALSLLIGAF